MKFRDIINESLQGEFQVRIRKAKKGEAGELMKEIAAAFQDKKLNQKEFDMLSAMCGRKMDQLGEEVNESNYKIKDGKVLITKKNYDKKPKDYKGGKKGAETLLVMDPKTGGAVSMPVEFINEDIEGINNTGIGYLITYSMHMIAQTHVWHLLCANGQKHTALGEFYEELQDEVDELAERFIAQGGVLETVNEPLIAIYDEEMVMARCQQYRNMVTSCVDNRPDMASIVDGIVDLQEVIDSKLYKFKLS